MKVVISLIMLLILIVIISLIFYYLQKGSLESFQHVNTPLTIGENQGIPLVFLSSMQAPDNTYYKELDAKAITQLVSKVDNIITIDAFIANINSWLPSFDDVTGDVLFKVVSHKELSNNTKQVTIYRDGKMYGFVVEVTIGKGASVTGFILEQDIKMNLGYDPIGSNTRLYDIEPKQFARKEIITKLQQDVDEIVKKQSDALLQDRGISSLILA